MNIEHFFPTSLGSHFDPEMADKMLPLARKHLDNKDELTYEWNYKNTYKTKGGLNEYPEFKEFEKYIHLKARDYLDTLGFVAPEEFSTQIFASEMFEGDKHGPHTHPNAIISGVFYLQVPEGSSNILFNDPRPYRKYVNLEVKENTMHNYDHVFYKPEKGLLLMWQSWLEHEVPVTENKEGRITLVFNLGNQL